MREWGNLPSAGRYAIEGSCRSCSLCTVGEGHPGDGPEIAAGWGYRMGINLRTPIGHAPARGYALI
jgi:hypothetical protein